jgi:hypothetical protein
MYATRGRATFAGFLLLLIASIASSSVAANSVAHGADSFGMPPAPGPGQVGLFVEDDFNQILRPSTLRRITVPEEGTPLCLSISDTSCSGKMIMVHAILPRCDINVQTDCIQAIAARDESGVSLPGNFTQYFPESSPSNFQGDSSLRVPNGSTSSVWNIPGAPHAGGTSYLALVTIDGGIDAERSYFGGHFPSLQVALFPVKIVAGQFAPWVADPSGVSTTSQDAHGNCAALSTGFCAARQEFPKGFRFSITLKLSDAPAGWLSGRIFDPLVEYQRESSNTTLTVEAKPVIVPTVAFWAEGSKVPLSLAPACPPDQMCGWANGWHRPTSVDEWRSFYQDKAAWSRSIWTFKNAGGSAGGSANSCFSDESIFHGLATTNASSYTGGPPMYSTTDKTFSYGVGSPHFDENGKVLSGAYSLVMRSSTARCLYGIEQGLMSATISVVEGDDGVQTGFIESVSDDGTWLRVNASGFHYSSPDIRVKLTSKVVPTEASISEKPSAPSLPALQSTAPKKATTKTTKLSNGAVLKVAISARKSQTIKTKSLLKPSRGVVVTKVSSLSKKVCTIRGSSVKMIKRGTCRLTVATKYKSKRSSARVAIRVS